MALGDDVVVLEDDDDVELLVVVLLLVAENVVEQENAALGVVEEGVADEDTTSRAGMTCWGTPTCGLRCSLMCWCCRCPAGGLRLQPQLQLRAGRSCCSLHRMRPTVLVPDPFDGAAAACLMAFAHPESFNLLLRCSLLAIWQWLLVTSLAF